MMDASVLAKAHSGIAILVILTFLLRGLILLGLYITHLKSISFSDGFVITKLICLGLFVLLSIFAFKQGLSKVTATVIWLLALATLVYAYLFGNQLVPAFF